MWRHEVLTVILDNDEVNLKTTNMLGMTEHRYGKHLNPVWHHCAAELKSAWQPSRDGPQISVTERAYWSVAWSTGSWPAPGCKQSMAATEVRSSSSIAIHSLSRVGHGDSVISAQHGTILWTLFLVELPVRLLLGFSEPQYILMLLLPNSSSLAPPFTGIRCELWSQGCLYCSWTVFSVPFIGAISQ